MGLNPKNDPLKEPSMPPGWRAKFDEKYKTWFYVNLDSKKSQWEAPAGSRFPGDDGDNIGPPPYDPSKGTSDGTDQRNANQNVSLAQNQGSTHGASRQQGYSVYPQQQPTYGGYPHQGYGGHPQQGFGGYQQPGYGGYPQPGYGGYPQPGYGQYPQPYPQQYPPQAQQQKNSRFGGGSGVAMGAGAGLLGGLLISDAIHDSQADAYEQGYDNGYDNADAGGGDFGGGDFGGGE